ncbi:MAG TPA: CYCXC family (seleno)protein [Nitrospinota bacterium]|nr:CYCXC family (seleno)protein [Nitrospinota bacterium]|tara:strand:+ start:58003 stop:58449 length:447 start_codon:yes stop_codon:yes gene_type:complete
MNKSLATMLILGLAVVAGSAMAQSKSLMAEIIQNTLLESKERLEKRETLEPRLFSRWPKQNRTYQIAKEIPDTLDKVFCYCYCEINPQFKHKSLLTCFVTQHAANCGICMNQALETWDMKKLGKSEKEIVVYFKSKYQKNNLTQLDNR